MLLGEQPAGGPYPKNPGEADGLLAAGQQLQAREVLRVIMDRTQLKVGALRATTGTGIVSRDIECHGLTAVDLRGQFGRARQELGRGVEGLPSLTKDHYAWLVTVNGSSGVTSDVLLSAIDLELRTFGTVWQSATGDLRDQTEPKTPQ